MKEFEKIVRIGNFLVGKIKGEYNEGMYESLAEAGISEEVKEFHDKNGYVPYITIGDVSGLWQSFFVYGTTVYQLYDDVIASGEVEEEVMVTLEAMLRHMFLSCTMLGDAEYYKKSGQLDNELIDRLEKTAEEGEDGES